MGISVGKAIQKIEKEGISPNYFLLGNDSYLQKIFIDKIKVKTECSDPVKYLNLNDDYDMDLFTSDLQSTSMFSKRTVYCLRYFNKLSKKKQIFIEEHVNNPSLDNILCFILDDYRITNNFSKKIADNSILIDIKTPFFENKLKEWINYYAKKKSYSLDYNTVQFLIENYSDDLSNIFNEIEKMNLYKNNSNIEFDSLNVYYSNRDIKIWNLLNAIGLKKINDSLKIYNKLSLSGVSLVPIIISLTTFFSELLIGTEHSSNQYNGLNKIINKKLPLYNRHFSREEVVEIILQLRNMDILLKSTSIKENLLFFPFLYKICGSYYGK